MRHSDISNLDDMSLISTQFAVIIILQLILHFIRSTHPSLIKSVELTPSTTNTHTNTNGTSITIANPDCTISNNQWDIKVTDGGGQQGYHLEIDLDSSWGFHPSTESTITFSMYSPTSLNVNDLDLFVTFSVNSHQFITPWFHLDNQMANEIYPTCISSQSFGAYDVKSCVDQTECVPGCTSRDCKALGQAEDLEGDILPSNDAYPNAFPMKLEITNNPNTDTASFSVTTPSWGTFTQGCDYAESFDTNSGLQIYLALQKSGEEIKFDKFIIDYFHTTSS